ncbi:MAG: 2OG-Fe(II) oxygenase family protein [Lysobacterales bacterium]
MLNPNLELDRYRQLLALSGRVQIGEFLQNEVAERLHQCLADEVPWTLALRCGAESRTIAHAEWSALDVAGRAALLQDAYRGVAVHAFQFVYESYMMVRAYQEGRDPGLYLHGLLEYLNSAAFLDRARWLTGDPAIRAASAQATCYRPGYFLTQHNDHNAEEGRAFAYVINLTRRWHPDWGGLLQFHGEQGQVSQTLMPRWNAISLFKVPQMHSVSLVSPWAEQPRYAITGWLRY